MGFIRKAIENRRKLNAVFSGEYIIELMHRVDVEDDVHPFYYFEKEYFLCKAKGAPNADIKQLTGKNAGTIYTDVQMQESNKGIGIYNITAGDFVGEVYIHKYLYEHLSVRELGKRAKAYNKQAKDLASKDYAPIRNEQFYVDIKFDTAEESTVEETETIEQ